MPLFNEIATLKTDTYVKIDIINNDPNDYTAAPVFADIPSSFLSVLNCDWSQMRLEDSNGNPVTFWPDGNGANPVYPGYYSIWFKVDLPASGTVSLKLYCDPDNPTYTANATDVVTLYYDLSDSSQLRYMDQHSTIDTNLYVDPPGSLWQMKSTDQVTNATAANGVNIQYADIFILKINWLMKNAGSGHIPGTRDVVNGNDSWAGPYVWFGRTSPWVSYGTNIGYYDTRYHVLGQYQADGQWHRVLLHARATDQNFDLYYDSTQLGSNLSFIQGYNPFTPDADIYLELSEVAHDTPDTSDNHIDSIVFVAVPYSTLPSVSTSLSIAKDASCLARPLSTF